MVAPRPDELSDEEYEAFLGREFKRDGSLRSSGPPVRLILVVLTLAVLVWGTYLLTRS